MVLVNGDRTEWFLATNMQLVCQRSLDREENLMVGLLTADETSVHSLVKPRMLGVKSR